MGRHEKRLDEIQVELHRELNRESWMGVFSLSHDCNHYRIVFEASKLSFVKELGEPWPRRVDFIPIELLLYERMSVKNFSHQHINDVHHSMDKYIRFLRTTDIPLPYDQVDLSVLHMANWHKKG